MIRKLYQKRIVLDFTGHLSDRELYCLIYRDILPAREKKIEWPNNYLHWDCTGPNGDPEVWLRYYATDEEREDWSETYGQPLPLTRTVALSAEFAPRTGIITNRRQNEILKSRRLVILSGSRRLESI